MPTKQRRAVIRRKPGNAPAAPVERIDVNSVRPPETPVRPVRARPVERRTSVSYSGPAVRREGPPELYPLDAPGMPVPGPDAIRWASALGDDTEVTGKGKNCKVVKAGAFLASYYHDLLHSYGTERFTISLDKSLRKTLPVVSGHCWGDEHEMAGPVPADVMVIGKNLGEEEERWHRNFIGPTGELLLDTCRMLQVPGICDWYMTNLLKTVHPQADTGESRLKKPWINEWLPLLHQEIRMVQPRYILCLGADASKALLGDQASVAWMEGRVVEWEYPISRAPAANGAILTKQALVMTITHPAAVLRYPADTPKFENGLARFGQLTRGLRWDRDEAGVDHRLIDSTEELRDLYYEIQGDCEKNRIAIDAEWHGEHPENEGSYLRSIQIAWKSKTAACIALRSAGGGWRFHGSMKDVVHWLKRICKGRRLAGQFLNSDLEWLVPIGLDLREQFKVATTWEATMEQALGETPQGGFDTGLAAHAISEEADNSLTALTLRYTTAPRYDIHLENWKRRYCLKNKIKAKDLEGYGECPDEILFGKPVEGVPGKVVNSYSCFDSDVTWRLVDVLQELLNSDRFGNNCWEAFWISMRAEPAALEITRNGVLIDRERLDRLTESYMTGRARLESTIRTWARWPGFNVNSVYQVREFLFGEQLNGKGHDPGTPPVRIRPAEARSLKLRPIMSTDKRPMLWDDVERRSLTGQKTPSTGKLALSILAQENQSVVRWNAKAGKTVKYDFSDQINWIRDYRFISQVLKSTLRLPCVDKETQDFIRGKDGYYVYPSGLPAALCDDARVRTHIYQTKETGRWSSARPPLHNLSKRREKDYKRILGPDYLYPLRTVITAPPDHLLVEADYVGAELYGMAIMSGDPLMIEHARRNLLPEWDPDYYDIHSHIAVLAFSLDCPPTKGGLKSIGKDYLRIVAKSVVFGVAYGRMAKAIALAVKEEGVKITIEEAQQVIDTIFATYPRLVPFFARCRQRALQQRWLCGCFGRFRRFEVAREFATEGEFERQAMNFPIQGMIADMVSRAVDHLLTWRDEHPEMLYRLVLQIHDALLFEVPIPQVPRFIDEVLPLCMVDKIPVYPTDLEGFPTGTGPYRLGISIEPGLHWGEHMRPDACLRVGLDPKYAGWRVQKNGYTHPEQLGKLWVGDINGGQLVDLKNSA